MTSFRRVLMLVALVGCSRGKPATPDQPGDSRTVVSAETLADSTTTRHSAPVHLRGAALEPTRAMLNGVGRGSTLEQVRTQLGSPDGTSGPVHEAATGVTSLTWIYPGMQVIFSDRRVVGMSCTVSRCATAEGVKMGSALSLVLRVYGAVLDADNLADGSSVAYPIVRDESCSLVFEFTQQKVSAINLSCRLN